MIKSKVEMQHDLYANVQAANDGDAGALELLRRQLSGPDGETLIDVVGDLGNQVQEAIFASMIDGAGTILCVRRKLETMRKELAYSSASPLEKLLIERVCQCWLHLCCVENISIHAQNVSLASAKYNLLRLDRANVRYLSAVRTLASVRKLPVSVAPKTCDQSKLIDGNKFSVGDRFAMARTQN